MAQKRISRARKRDLEKPDEFITLTSRVLGQLGAHWKSISAGFGILLVVLAVFLAFGYFSQRAEEKAQFLLTQAMNRYSEERGRLDADKAIDAVAADFEALFNDYGDTRAGAAGRLFFAQMHYRAGRMAEALAYYEAALPQFPEGSYRAAAALSGVGYARAATGEHAAAIEAFAGIVAGEDPVLKPDALYQLALLYRRTGQDAAYEQALRTLNEDYPDFVYAGVLPLDVNSN